MKLEERQMFDVEGGSYEWCMRILRHEAGHAIDTAYKLSDRADWQRVFGKPTRYPKTYQPKPYSKSFVLHLDTWYAQSHPSEDFAETFAVWLRPRSQWRRRYAGWPALRKLEFVDRLMKEIAGARPVRTTRRRVEPLHSNRMTLREHYQRKHQRYGASHPVLYDRDLQLLFSNHLEGKTQTASQFLRRARPDLRRMVSKWTGEYQYTIDQVLAEMISRSQDLKLRAAATVCCLMLQFCWPFRR
jgi:hypothetical protein